MAVFTPRSSATPKPGIITPRNMFSPAPMTPLNICKSTWAINPLLGAARHLTLSSLQVALTLALVLRLGEPRHQTLAR
jgi:hypothetical protein